MQRLRPESFPGFATLRAMATLVLVIVLVGSAVSDPAHGTGITLKFVNNCSTTLYARGENPPGLGSVGLPNNNTPIPPNGGIWTTTMPVPWPAGRVWVCPFNTAGLDPWSTDGNNFTYGCQWIESTTGNNGGAFVNLNPTYIDGIWIPVHIAQTGGTCTGTCEATCTSRPSVQTIQTKCPTGFWGQYNNDKCMGMNGFCDPGLGAGHSNDPRCQSAWLAAQITAYNKAHGDCPALCGNAAPTPFQVYGCGNSCSWLTDGCGQLACAALNRGVAGQASSQWSNPGTFYPPGIDANPFSAWIHETLECKAYAFPYDDTSSKQGGDMTYNDPNGTLVVTATWCPWG